MICVSIYEDSVAKTLAELEDHTNAEIRLDLLQPTTEELARIFGRPGSFIATMRPERFDDEVRSSVLIQALEAGADFVDVEIESDEAFKSTVIHAARALGKQVIVSHHDYEKTPDLGTLRSIIDQCYKDGADIAKVACMVNATRDNAKLLGLMDNDKSVVALGMGPLGKITRVAGLLLGAPFTFASSVKGKEAAPGQVAIAILNKIYDLLESNGKSDNV